MALTDSDLVDHDDDADLKAASQRTDDRLRIASDSPPAPDHARRLATQQAIRGYLWDAAFEIEANVQPCREASLALTHLEEALMWAGKAIFR
ncbi:MAG: hypothetical protein J0I33_07720 [Microbacterium ginsengisoli]|jgi:hypothetical protein|uniref:Acb2/Tad1 domain-containing protein n=1 Tax=Microbacterium TaxID=33882 RepID=UPI0006F6386E|nr:MULTISPECIES: hypothetical protein [unclassified Microbacterium]KQR97686.1 hypothetical protein ASF93_13235 [Microbacterium sp. Leaf347]KQS01711.1 hypothetical protein ASG00_09750 [Microbacterium sp. Leaf351]MBN9198511.1 hypothetical protein [Microbacterium ginsengisoli]OJU78103.1 MAG: hypothetical protein BGO15_02565 [Microbacterium sp. 71-23]